MTALPKSKREFELPLPVMNGREVLRRLKSETTTREITVVVLTANATKDQPERMEALGAAEYLTKPLDVLRFIEVIALSLGTRGAAARAEGRETGPA